GVLPCRGPVSGAGKGPLDIPGAVRRASIETPQNSYRTSGSDTRKSACRKRCLEESTIQAAERAEIGRFWPAAPLDFGYAAGKGFDRKVFMRSSFYRLCLLSLFATSVTSCEEDVRYSGQTQYLGGVYGNAPTTGAPSDSVSYWDGDHIGGKPSVKISLKEQRAYFYKNNMLVGISQLSTGREGLNTPLGKFSIISKDINHASSRYGDFVDDAGNVVMPNVDVQKDKKPPGTHYKGASMPYYMQIAPGFGMHAGYLPGYPASHGCIRMPQFMAENFFKSVSTGTPVAITN